MNRGASLNPPNFLPSVGGISCEFAGTFALKDEISRSAENTAISSDGLFHHPFRRLAHRVPGQKLSFFGKLVGRQAVGFDIV